MTQNIQELERDIEETRARLDLTIDRIQDRMSVSGIVDDFLGSAKSSRFGPMIDNAVEIVRRNPIPVILVAAGVGLLLHRMSQGGRGRASLRPTPDVDGGVRVMNTGNVRVYDPDASSLHPGQDSLDSRRDLSARA